ncbi:hypothetical protein PMI16_04365 [Herbaspirillum sp. CF444]|uniref:hypothetical protein n=1 Tax=Herbaspirillum sp. CF444 TaxID=1144319 RepID=UPI0002725852|nr:hypothetical protein [Herbaspirillum sp. CF444]EJL83035.1 hypothetical protein PMI16_04365 [Herbaspirillum sp. CF444]
MSTLWPWLAVAGAGALHGLNPCTGWMFAAAWGLRSRNRLQALRALMPIAAGHATSVALVAVAVALGVEMERITWKITAGILLAALILGIAYRLSGRSDQQRRTPTSHVGLALWSCMMSTLHGAGLMLVPALVPLCLSNSPAREITASGSLLLALAAVGVHMAAMLAVTAMMATATTLVAGVRRRTGGVARLLH